MVAKTKDLQRDRTHYGIMISAEDGEELDEAVEHDATDTTWSWVKSFVNLCCMLLEGPIISMDYEFLKK